MNAHEYLTRSSPSSLTLYTVLYDSLDIPQYTPFALKWCLEVYPNSPEIWLRWQEKCKRNEKHNETLTDIYKQ